MNDIIMLKLGFYQTSNRMSVLRKEIDYLKELPRTLAVQERINLLESELEMIWDVEKERIDELSDL